MVAVKMELVLTQAILTHVNVRMDILEMDSIVHVGCHLILFD